ncbi:putative DNA binding domain-containing protein [Myxococcota bacterium]|nr:putative DNA binding domain-containing protein [Myxococcota bacterium]
MNLRIQNLISAGESRTVEFKTAHRALNQDIYETICAFLNRAGGDILLGVKDDGTVQGVDPTHITQMKQDFANTINNPQKINPPSWVTMEEIQHEGVGLLHITVPPSSQVHRSKNRIFDRNEDGDFDITDNQTLVTQLYLSKQSQYSENTVYPWFSIDDLRPDLIDRARQMAAGHLRAHPWLRLNDTELLTSARLLQHDSQKNTDGPTLAAIMLFGKDDTILSVQPHHRVDAIMRRISDLLMSLAPEYVNSLISVSPTAAMILK